MDAGAVIGEASNAAEVVVRGDDERNAWGKVCFAGGRSRAPFAATWHGVPLPERAEADGRCVALARRASQRVLGGACRHA